MKNAFTNPVDADNTIIDAAHSHSHNTDKVLTEAEHDFEYQQSPEFKEMKHFHLSSEFAYKTPSCSYPHETLDDLSTPEIVMKREVENTVMRALNSTAQTCQKYTTNLQIFFLHFKVSFFIQKNLST